MLRSKFGLYFESLSFVLYTPFYNLYFVSNATAIRLRITLNNESWIMSFEMLQILIDITYDVAQTDNFKDNSKSNVDDYFFFSFFLLSFCTPIN